MHNRNDTPFHKILFKNVKKKKISDEEQDAIICAIQAITELDDLHQKIKSDISTIYDKFNQATHAEIKEPKVEAGLNSFDRDHQTPLIYAADNGHTKIVTKLIESKASLDLFNLDGNTALFRAEQENHSDIFAILLEAKASLTVKLSYKTESILFQAASNGHLNHVKQLIQLKVPLDEQPISLKETALIAASSGGHTDVVLELIAAKASLNLQSSLGYTALGSAVDYPVIVNHLIEAGASLDIQHHNPEYPLLLGQTALMNAAMKNAETSVELLISAKVNVQLCNSLKESALDYAIRFKNFPIIGALLHANAKIKDPIALDELLFLSKEIEDCNLIIAMSALLTQKNTHAKSEDRHISKKQCRELDKQLQKVHETAKVNQVPDELLESTTKLPNVLRDIVRKYDCGFDRIAFFQPSKSTEDNSEPPRKRLKLGR